MNGTDDASAVRSYDRLTIAGPISVESSMKLREGITYRILLMGLTGVGKSAFVECIGNDKQLGISKDQLDGVTQELMVYRVNGVMSSNWPIYLIDTPGFSDYQIPETKTLRMVQEWMKENKVDVVNRILYFDRITDNRMAGTKGKVLDMFKAITGQGTGSNLSIVTTMWDCLWNDKQFQKADARLDELRDVHWKNFIDEGAALYKFENTHESALNILDRCLGSGTGTLFGFERMCRSGEEMAKTSFAPNLYRNLIERKLALEQQIQMLTDDMCDESSKANPTIIQELSNEMAKTRRVLCVVEEEVEMLGTVELPEDSEELNKPSSTTSQLTPADSPKLAGRSDNNLIRKTTHKMRNLFSRRRG